MSLGFPKLTNTLPSRTALEVLDASVLGKIVGNISVHFTNSGLFPKRMSPHFNNDGGYSEVSWLKNLSIFPPLI